MKAKFLRRILFVCVGNTGLALAQATFTKVQVADRIRRVEAGVDQFRKCVSLLVRRSDKQRSAEHFQFMSHSSLILVLLGMWHRTPFSPSSTSIAIAMSARS